MSIVNKILHLQVDPAQTSYKSNKLLANTSNSDDSLIALTPFDNFEFDDKIIKRLSFMVI